MVLKLELVTEFSGDLGRTDIWAHSQSFSLSGSRVDLETSISTKLPGDADTPGLIL